MRASPRPLRLLVLADGASIHTEMWVRGLAASGPSEIHLVTMNSAGVRAGIQDIASVERVHVINAGAVNPDGGNWRYLVLAPTVLRLVRRIRPDVVVAIYLSSYGAMGALVRGQALLANVILGSDVMVTPVRSSIMRWVVRAALARGQLCVSPSMACTTQIRDFGSVPPESILTQQYGLEDWILDRPPLPSSYDLVSNRAWLPNSQIPMLLRVLRRLELPARIALVGSGGPHEPEILELAAEDPRVAVLGTLSHQENLDVVARSRFYVAMTESDGASLSLMEAMALGAIPAVSDIAANREWISHEVNGVLLPLDDEAEAAARITALMATPEPSLSAMRAANRSAIRERGSLSRNMARFRSRLEMTLDQRGSHP